MERRIIPLSGNSKTCPARILPGSLHLFTHPAQAVLGPIRARFEERYRRPDRFAAALVGFDAFAAALVLALAVILGSFVLAPGTAAPIRLTVAASAAEARSGDLIGFSVRYENRGKQPLANAQLALALPDDFHVTSLDMPGTGVEPLTAHNAIALGTIPPGGNGTVRVAGYVLQPEKAVADLRLHGTLTGTPGGEPIQSSSDATVHISGSALQLRWAGAPALRATVGGELMRMLAVTNDGAVDIKGLQVNMMGAMGISKMLLDVKAGQTSVVDEYQMPLPPNLGVPWKAWLTEPPRVTEEDALVFSSVDNDRTDIGPRVEITRAELAGDAIDVHARITSTGPALDRGELRLFPQPWSAVDASKLPADAEAEGIPVGSFTVASGTPSEVVFRIPFAAATSTDGLTVRAVASACVVAADDCAWSSSARVAVRPQAISLTGELRYYTEEGEQLGRGPLPPRVEEKTEYWIVFHVNTFGRRMENAELRVPLGNGVVWSGKQSTSLPGASVPVVSGGSVVWRLGVIASPAGETATVALGLALRPTVDQVDSEPTVAAEALISGRDAANGETVSAQVGPFTTAVPFDVRAAAKGTRIAPALQ